PVEMHGVRIACLAGHGDVDLAGGGVEAADAAVAVARIPDDALIVDDERVGVGALLDLVAAELLRLWIEHGHVVPLLPDEPDLSVGRDVRITRAAAPLDGPFLEVRGG